MKKLFSLAASLVFVLCCAATASAWEDINATDAADMLAANPDAYILDVRTVCEYKFVGHCAVPEGQIKNIPFWMFEFDRATDEYLFYAGGIANENKFFDEEVYRFFDPSTDTIIVVCKTGGRAGMASTDLEDRSEPAANRLEELGCFNVLRMKDGFVGKPNADLSWLEAGLPVSTGYEGIWKPSDFKGRSLHK